MLTFTKPNRFMKMAISVIVIQILLLNAIVNAVPVPKNTDLEEVSNIASQPCKNPNTANSYASSDITASVSEESSSSKASYQTRLQNLRIELLETAEMANNTFEKIKQWTNLFTLRDQRNMHNVLNKMQIPRNVHSSLNEEVSSRLRVLEQLSNYAYFLMKNEDNPAFRPYGFNGTALIKNLRIKIMRVLCILRGLVPLTNYEIKNFSVQDIAEHLIPPETLKGTAATKRGYCVVAINIMIDTMKQIQLNVETNSLVIADNF